MPEPDPDPIVAAARFLAFTMEAAMLDDSKGVTVAERCRAGTLVGLRHLREAGIIVVAAPYDWAPDRPLPGAAEVRAEFAPRPTPPDWFTNVPERPVPPTRKES